MCPRNDGPSTGRDFARWDQYDPRCDRIGSIESSSLVENPYRGGAGRQGIALKCLRANQGPRCHMRQRTGGPIKRGERKRVARLECARGGNRPREVVGPRAVHTDDDPTKQSSACEPQQQAARVEYEGPAAAVRRSSPFNERHSYHPDKVENGITTPSGLPPELCLGKQAGRQPPWVYSPGPSSAFTCGGFSHLSCGLYTPIFLTERDRVAAGEQGTGRIVLTSQAPQAYRNILGPTATAVRAHFTIPIPERRRRCHSR